MSGGLTLTVVNSWKGEKPKGMKSTIIHFLPIELLAFLEIAPYLFLNKEDTAHTFWMAFGGMTNLLHEMDEALESKHVQQLNKIINMLKEEALSETLIYVSDDPANEDLAPVDVYTLSDSRFQPLADCILKEDGESEVKDMIVCLKMYMRYKLINFEDSDKFEKQADVAFQEPPLLIWGHDAKYRVEYNSDLSEIEVTDGEEIFYVPRYDANTEEIRLEPSTTGESEEMHQADDLSSKNLKRRAEEKQMFTMAEINEANEAAKVLCETTTQPQGLESPQHVSTPKKTKIDETNLSFESQRVNGSRTPSPILRKPERRPPMQLHFHIPAGVSEFTVVNVSDEKNEWKINLN